MQLEQEKVTVLSGEIKDQIKITNPKMNKIKKIVVHVSLDVESPSPPLDCKANGPRIGATNAPIIKKNPTALELNPLTIGKMITIWTFLVCHN